MRRLWKIHTEYLGAMVEKENEEVRKEQEKVVGQAQKEAADKQKKDSEKETEKSQRNKSVTATPEVTQAVLVSNNIQPAPCIDLSPQTLADYNYLMNQFFIVDSQTTTNADQLNAAELLGEDLTIQKMPQNRRSCSIIRTHRKLLRIQRKGKSKIRSSVWEIT